VFRGRPGGFVRPGRPVPAPAAEKTGTGGSPSEFAAFSGPQSRCPDTPCRRTCNPAPPERTAAKRPVRRTGDPPITRPAGFHPSALEDLPQRTAPLRPTMSRGPGRPRPPVPPGKERNRTSRRARTARDQQGPARAFPQPRFFLERVPCGVPSRSPWNTFDGVTNSGSHGSPPSRAPRPAPPRAPGSAGVTRACPPHDTHIVGPIVCYRRLPLLRPILSLTACRGGNPHYPPCPHPARAGQLTSFGPPMGNFREPSPARSRPRGSARKTFRSQMFFPYGELACPPRTPFSPPIILPSCPLESTPPAANRRAAPHQFQHQYQPSCA